jgi:hypothetical protein
MTIMMSKIATTIAEYSKISSKFKGGVSSLVGMLASFAEGFLGKSSGVSVDSKPVRGGCSDSKVVVCGPEPNVCTEAVASESCEGSERVVGSALSPCEGGPGVEARIGGGREGVVGGDILSKLDVCGTT